MNTIKGLASNVWFAIFVVFPTMLAVVYYGLIAAEVELAKIEQMTEQGPR